MIITDLVPGEMYYFAIQSRDEAFNYSGISNLASAEAYVDLSTGGDDDPPLMDDLMLSPPDNSNVNSTRPTLEVVNIDSEPYNVYHFEVAVDSYFVS